MGEKEKENIAGIDVSKAGIEVWVDPGPAQRFDNNHKGIAALVEWLRLKKVVMAAYEPARGYERELVRRLGEAAIRADPVNRKRVRAFARSGGYRAKTDASDARLLARFGQTSYESEALPEEPERSDLQEILKYRQYLANLRARERKGPGRGDLRVPPERSPKIHRAVGYSDCVAGSRLSRARCQAIGPVRNGPRPSNHPPHCGGASRSARGTGNPSPIAPRVTLAVEGLPRTPIRGENPRTNIPQGNVNRDATYCIRAEMPCSAIYHVEGRLSRPAALAYPSSISTTLIGKGMPFFILSLDNSHSISPGT